MMRHGAGGQSVRDRTSEFLAAAERIAKQQGAAAGPSSSSAGPLQPAKQSAAQQSEFAKRASAIGLSIHRTSVKLQRLAQLAKSTSMFDDPQAQIDELTGIIKQDIQGLNANIAELQRLRAGGENKQSADHSTTVVDTLRTRLKDATLQFKDVLTLRTENMRVHKERRQMFSAQPDGGAGPGGAFGGGPAAAAMLERSPLLPRGNAGEPRTAQSLFGGQPGGAGAGLQQQQQLIQQDAYVSSRAEALQNVETTIVELGTIFQQLAEMVHAQGEVAQRIDENIEETLANVDGAKAQLMRYLNSMSGNRWLVLKVFSVLLVFMLLFVVFIA